jgi:cysteine desulfurase
MNPLQVYADANATFPVRPSHYDDVMKLLRQSDGNPSSIHAQGREAKVALESARAAVAAMVGARPPEIIFTSGATEANNLVIQGVIWKARSEAPSAAGGRDFLPEVIVSGYEHPSVMAPAQTMADRGLCKLVIAPVSNYEVTPETVTSLMTPATVLVCVMHVNNETGSVNRVQDIAAAVAMKNPGVHMHVDAVQALGKFDLTRYKQSAIHSASTSAHKIGGFKGVGALFLQPGRKLSLLTAGGGQERARRPGTENLPGIFSFGLRCRELLGQSDSFTAAMKSAKVRFVRGLQDISGAVLHGDPEKTAPNTVNFHIEGVAGDDLLLNLDLCGVCASSGSACSSGVSRPSPVLLACGQSEWVALNSIRISFTDDVSDRDVDHILSVLRSVTARMRK